MVLLIVRGRCCGSGAQLLTAATSCRHEPLTADREDVKRLGDPGIAARSTLCSCVLPQFILLHRILYRRQSISPSRRATACGGTLTFLLIPIGSAALVRSLVVAAVVTPLTILARACGGLCARPLGPGRGAARDLHACLSRR